MYFDSCNLQGTHHGVDDCMHHLQRTRILVLNAQRQTVWTSFGGIRRGVRDRPSSPKSKCRFHRNSGQNKRVTELGASPTTPAAFQSGQHNRWLAAATCGITPAQVRQDVRDFQLFQTVLRGRKTPWQGQRVLLAFFRPSPADTVVKGDSDRRECIQYTLCRQERQARITSRKYFHKALAGSAAGPAKELRSANDPAKHAVWGASPHQWASAGCPF
ncbi:hypothetical protein Mal4_48320 [Maioricimonas rarisocia]|uniref:Uncharacterized protein n=1 Tax=Maioricimonas rarisocia TaxID=2528026 RepID=A0A517ZDD3_9PLAN|nr:hypothetical protein Mal4_48320 [Maioricimonas rarisocia]